MNITYTREYSRVMVADVNQMTDVVQSYYCNITGIDSDSGVSIPVGIEVSLSSPENKDTFIQFNDLTKEILDAWTDSAVDIGYLESTIAESIDAIVNPKTIVKELPFS